MSVIGVHTLFFDVQRYCKNMVQKGENLPIPFLSLGVLTFWEVGEQNDSEVGSCLVCGCRFKNTYLFLPIILFTYQEVKHFQLIQ